SAVPATSIAGIAALAGFAWPRRGSRKRFTHHRVGHGARVRRGLAPAAHSRFGSAEARVLVRSVRTVLSAPHARYLGDLVRHLFRQLRAGHVVADALPHGLPSAASDGAVASTLHQYDHDLRELRLRHADR